MTDGGTERRQNFSDFVAKLEHLDRAVTVMQTQLKGQATIRNVLWGMSAVLVSLSVSAVYGFGQMTEQLSHYDMTDLEQHQAASFTVLADHGTELAAVRTEDARLRQVMDTVRSEIQIIRTEINTRTDDRYRRSDANHDRNIDRELQGEKLSNIIQRIEHLESEHHGLNRK